MAPRRMFNINIDERTNELSDEALLCRSLGHKWTLRATSRKRFNELLANGLAEYFRYCDHGCGSTWRQTWSISDGTVVENERSYPREGYRMPANSGRLARGAARIAQFGRQYEFHGR